MAVIDNDILGALKNEYPNGNQNETAIQKFAAFNKKIYQYMINNEWHTKFKGCKSPDDNM